MKSTQTLGLAILIATSFQVYAQNDRAAFREAIEACRSEVGDDRVKVDACLTAKGISKPERGGRGPRPEMDEPTKAAFSECFASTGVTKPERGQRPSEDDRAKISACLEGKGISSPHGGQGSSRSSAGSEQ